MYEWHLKLKRLNTKRTTANFWMLFGISSTQKVLNQFGIRVNSDDNKYKECAVAYHLGSRRMHSSVELVKKSYHLDLSHNDVLILRLDLNKKRIEYYINYNYDKCIAFAMIYDKFKYRMMICICDSVAHLTLLNFKRIE